MIMFTMADRYVKAASILGAYEKAMAGKVKDIQAGDRKAAIKYGGEVMNKTQFDMSVINSPGAFRYYGPLGQILLQFKKYPVKQLEFVMGGLKGAENTTFWASYLLLAGFLGFPGIEVLKDLIKALFGVDFEEKIKKNAFEMAGDSTLMKGIVRNIFYGAASNVGVDISKAIDMGSVVPTEMKDLAGPTLSTIGRLWSTFSDNVMSADTAKLMIGDLSPQVYNYMVALNQAKPISPTERERMRIEYTPMERLLKFIGLKPLRETMESDKSYIIKTEENERKEKNKQLIDKYIAHKIPFSELEKAGITKEQVKQEIKRKQMTKLERTKDLVPDTRMKDYESVLRF